MGLEVCFLEGFLLELQWVFVLLLQLCTLQRYENFNLILLSVFLLTCYYQKLGFTSFCERHLWELHSDCNVSWTYSFFLHWNPCKGRASLVGNMMHAYNHLYILISQLDL